MIIINNKTIWFILVNDSRTNHLGKNPKKGGKPPKDKKFIKNKNFIVLLIK